MTYAYFYLPFLAWCTAFICKLTVNSLKARTLSLKNVTHGGMPSNHATISSSMTAFIFFQQGLSPALGVATMITLIICMDAHTLRRQVSLHAIALNQLKPGTHLRERLGHTYFQIFAGITLGVALAYVVHIIGV